MYCREDTRGSVVPARQRSADRVIEISQTQKKLTPLSRSAGCNYVEFHEKVHLKTHTACMVLGDVWPDPIKTVGDALTGCQ
jgi:hypothetical protein